MPVTVIPTYIQHSPVWGQFLLPVHVVKLEEEVEMSLGFVPKIHRT